MEALSSAIEDLGDPPTDPSVISIPKFEDLVEPLHDFESTQDEIVELESLDPINEKEDLCPNGSDSKEPVKTMTVETCSEISRENPSLDLSDSCKEIGFSSDSIEQELGMVSLVGDAEEESKSKEVVKTEKDIYFVSDAESGEIKSSSDSDSDSDSESDSDSDSDSSSSLSSSDGDEEDDSDDTDDDDEGDQEEEDEKINGDDDDEREKSDMDVTGDVEEGEIRGFDIEEIVGCSDDEEEIGVIKGPIKSKNEVEILPPVPPVNAALEPHHSTLPVGVILSMMGTKVVIEGLEKHNPLNEGSILWITESRAPLGMIDEIFGPVKNPYYVVRFNSVEEIPTGIHEGVTISYVEEFSNHVLNEKDLYKKGYDASGDNDEEVFDEVEFSDDEKEAEYRRSQRMAKRGPNDRKNGNREFVDRKHGNREFMDRKRVQVLATGELHKSIQPLGPGPPQAPSHLHMMQPATGQMGCGDCACSFNAGPNGMGGPVMVPSMSHMAQSSGFLGCPPQQLLPQHNTVWTNGIPAQQHHMGMLIPPNAFQMNGMPCLQQPDQIFNGFPNAMPCQQHFDPSQIPSHGLMLPGGQMNFPMGGPPATWQGPIGQGGFNQAQPFGMGLQGSVSLPQQFNPGAASFRGKRPYWPYSRGRGGNFSGGGRGRHQTR